MAGYKPAIHFIPERTVLSGTGNFARAQTTRANRDGLRSAVYNSLYLTDVGLPHSVCLAMRVGHVLSEYDALSANTAFCHS